MATFFGITTDLIRSRTPALKTTAEVFVEPGRDGYGVHTLGEGDARFVFVLVRLELIATVNSWIALIEAKQGQEGIVVDDWGETHSNMFAQRMSTPIKTAIIKDGVAAARGEITVEGVRLQ